MSILCRESKQPYGCALWSLDQPFLKSKKKPRPARIGQGGVQHGEVSQLLNHSSEETSVFSAFGSFRAMFVSPSVNSPVQRFSLIASFNCRSTD